MAAGVLRSSFRLDALEDILLFEEMGQRRRTQMLQTSPLGVGFS